MENHNFYALIHSRFSADPDKYFLLGTLQDTLHGIQQDDGFESIRYREIDALTAKIANLFSALRLQKGDRLVVQVDKSPMAVLLYLACLRAGIIYVPLNPAYTAEEVDYFLADASPGLFICSASQSDLLQPLMESNNIPHVLTLDELGYGTLRDKLKSYADCFEPVQISDHDTAVIIYTSGTTGKPKGAMLSHANLSSNALTLFQLWGWRRDDVLLHALPIFHVHGLFVALNLALLGGSTVLFLPKFDSKKIIQLLPRCSVLMGVPTFYTRLLQEKDFNQGCCANMRLFISGSAPLLEDTFNQFEQRSGHQILERYGMTEAGMLISNPLDGLRVAGTVGFPLPDVSIRVRDSAGNFIKSAEIGVLEVKGPNVFPGYWRMPEKTRLAFNDEFFITGDMVALDEQGRVTIIGRDKDLIISGGFNIYPKEVELVLDQQEIILESAVFGVPHSDLGEAAVVAVVINTSGAVDDALFNADEIVQTLSSRLAKYKLPKRIIVVDELPRNSMGKVQKNVLRSQYAEIFSS